MRTIPLGFLWVVLTVSVLVSAPTAAQEDLRAATLAALPQMPDPEPFLWPPPRRAWIGEELVELTGPGRASAAIVLGPEAEPRSTFAAQVLADAAARLAPDAAPLPVITTDEAAGTAERHLLVVGTQKDSPLLDRLCRDFAVPLSAERPGPEGYVIRTLPWRSNQRAVLIGGSDVQGALYGSYALEQLLVAREGRVYLREARVDDWPGFPLRVTGWGPEAYRQSREATQEDLEHLLRLRHNLGVFEGGCGTDLTPWAAARGLSLLDGYWAMQGFAQ